MVTQQSENYRTLWLSLSFDQFWTWTASAFCFLLSAFGFWLLAAASWYAIIHSLIDHHHLLLLPFISYSYSDTLLCRPFALLRASSSTINLMISFIFFYLLFIILNWINKSNSLCYFEMCCWVNNIFFLKIYQDYMS